MRRLIGLLLSVLLVAQLGSCVTDERDDSTARVRVLHVSPDAPNLDVLFDGARVLSNVPYSAASAYLIFPTGTHRITFNVAGTATTLIHVSQDLANAEFAKLQVLYSLKIIDSQLRMYERNPS